MSEMITGSVKCAVCGKYFSNKETICPNCGSMREGANKEPPGLEINVADKIAVSASTGVSLTHITINTESGAIKTSTTTIPPEVLNQEKEERDANATSLVFEQNKDLERFKDDIQKAVPASLEGDEERSSFQKGPIYVFNQCEIHGSIVGGEGHLIDIHFNDKWKQLENSINIKELLQELKTLIEHLPKMASSPEHYKDIAEVVRAREELNKANGPGMLKHLKRVGNWVLENAKDMSARVIVKLIKDQ